MLYWVILAALTFPVFILVSRMIFDDLDSFVEAFVYLFLSMGITALRGELNEAATGKLKLLIVLATWASAVAAVHQLFGPSLRGFVD